MTYHVIEISLDMECRTVAERWRFDFTSLINFLLGWLVDDAEAVRLRSNY
jgi:hypothetical protein